MAAVLTFLSLWLCVCGSVIGCAYFLVTVALCVCGSVIGTPFYIMKFVDGRVLKNPALPDMTPTERQASDA